MRALKALVVFMGILILGGMGLVAYAIVKRVGQPAPPPRATDQASATAPVAGKPFGPVEIALPPGARIARTSTSEGRLIVELELAGGGERLLLVDLASGALLGSIDLKLSP
jgi:hypothetical protein